MEALKAKAERTLATQRALFEEHGFHDLHT